MKHKGKAGQAGRKLIFWTLVMVLAVLGSAIAAVVVASFIAVASWILIPLWMFFGLFVLYFFRDPTPNVPKGENLIVSPNHGTVDAIDQVDEPEFMGGCCQRVSMFMTLFDVHVQKAPASGTVIYLRHRPGEFLNALRLESAAANENVLIGFQLDEAAGEKIAVRLIAGVLARRIVPWVALGDTVARGERISLIQFGSRCEVYLPLSARIEVKLGDKTTGGQTVVARLG
ncbi:MAG: phosphatidylserine decarboxylase [Candidatus Omnitrophica bacterium]|nr:phosphatidylserine decarboxylase [Candidatus Omnitrophota bacterium]